MPRQSGIDAIGASMRAFLCIEFIPYSHNQLPTNNPMDVPIIRVFYRITNECYNLRSDLKIWPTPFVLPFTFSAQSGSRYPEGLTCWTHVYILTITLIASRVSIAR